MERNNNMNTSSPDNTNTSSPDLLPEPDAVLAHAAGGIRSHRLKVRILSATAFFFGILAIVASLGLALSYVVFILPMQSHLFEEATEVARQHGTNAVARPEAIPEALRRMDDLLRKQIETSYITNLGTTMLAVAVGASGVGTLMLHLLVLLNRRASLKQVNASLAEISSQLRDLGPGKVP
jgi:hypothetical protein